MTFSPTTAFAHDFNTTIEYACVVGYNHSYGDLQRTCNYTGEWTGNLPNCTSKFNSLKMFLALQSEALSYVLDFKIVYSQHSR